jgi:hypothetical protein
MKRFVSSIFFVIAFISIIEIHAIRKPSSKVSKGYTKKAPYAGFGQKSSINNKIKTKSTRGYFKPTSGYKFVNPYARSN